MCEKKTQPPYSLLLQDLVRCSYAYQCLSDVLALIEDYSVIYSVLFFPQGCLLQLKFTFLIFWGGNVLFCISIESLSFCDLKKKDLGKGFDLLDLSL